MGSLIDSVLGATCQFSGKKAGTEVIVEEPGPDVIRISGMPLLDNHAVNLLSTVIIAVVMPSISMNFYY